MAKKIPWDKVWEKVNHTFGGPMVYRPLEIEWRNLIEKTVKDVLDKN